MTILSRHKSNANQHSKEEYYINGSYSWIKNWSAAGKISNVRARLDRKRNNIRVIRQKMAGSNMSDAYDCNRLLATGSLPLINKRTTVIIE